MDKLHYGGAVWLMWTASVCQARIVGLNFSLQDFCLCQGRLCFHRRVFVS